MTETLLPSPSPAEADVWLIDVADRYCSIGAFTVPGGIQLNTSTAWPTAKLVAYIPFTIRKQFTVRTIGWQNGTTPVGNVEVGIYNESGTRMGTSGSTAAGTSAAIQVTTPTAFTLPGFARYYFAVTCDNVGGSYTLSMSGSTIAAGTSGGLGIMTETTGTFGLTNPWGTLAVLTSAELFPNVFIANSTTA